MDVHIICIFGLIVNEQDVFYITKNAKIGYPDTDNMPSLFLSSLRSNDCMRVRSARRCQNRLRQGDMNLFLAPPLRIIRGTESAT